MSDRIVSAEEMERSSVGPTVPQSTLLEVSGKLLPPSVVYWCR